MSFGLKVRLIGFAEGERELHDASQSYEKVVERAFENFGKDLIRQLQARARAGEFGPPKKRGAGPPLIDTENYINSYRVEADGLTLGIGPTGMNTFLPNDVLGEILEYGNDVIPARPHIRKIIAWVEAHGVKKLGDGITRELFRST